jgi:hypothetical protein
VFARPGQPLKSTAYVPRDAPAFFALNVGSLEALCRSFTEAEGEDGQVVPEYFTETLDSILALVSETGMSSDELLAALGGEVSLVVGAPKESGVAPIALLVEITDRGIIERLTQGVTEVFASAYQDKLEVEAATLKDVPITTRKVEGSVLMATAIVGDFLVAGPDEDLIKAIIEARASHRAIGDDEQMRALASKVPGDGAFVMVGDVAGLGGLALSLVANQPGSDVERTRGIIEALGPQEGERQGFVLKLIGDPRGLTCRSFSQEAFGEPISRLCRVLYGRILNVRRESLLGVSNNNIHCLMMAMLVYADGHDDRLPSRLSELAPYTGDRAVFIHPSRSLRSLPMDLDKPETIDQYTDYDLLTPGVHVEDLQSDTLVVREKKAFVRGWRSCGFWPVLVKAVREESEGVE